jgi:hypothetical protein
MSSVVMRRRKLPVPGGYRTQVILAPSPLVYESIPTHNVLRMNSVIMRLE